MKLLRYENPVCRRFAAFTLVEVMVTLGIATLFVMGLIIFTTITFQQGIFSIGNYTDLNSKSRRTLDIMSRDIRNANGIWEYDKGSFYCFSTGVGVTNNDGSCVAYTWDGESQLRRWTRSPGSTSWKPTVVLTNCDYIRFNVYQRNPKTNYSFVSSWAIPDQTKLIDVSWRCSRSYIGRKLNTESVQTARIVMRN